MLLCLLTLQVALEASLCWDATRCNTPSCISRSWLQDEILRLQAAHSPIPVQHGVNSIVDYLSYRHEMGTRGVC
jgi:hypothetical protein